MISRSRSEILDWGNQHVPVVAYRAVCRLSTLVEREATESVAYLLVVGYPPADDAPPLDHQVRYSVG
eukprot:scaffold9402_cov50-Attheya_sp.AAC.2